MHDLVVIGGGPAALAAAAYTLEKHLDVALVCAAGRPGRPQLGGPDRGRSAGRGHSRRAAPPLQQGTRVLLVTPEKGQLAGALGRHLRAHADVELLEGYRVQAIEPAENGLHRLVAARGSLTRRATVVAVFVALGLVPGSQPVRQSAAVDPHGFLVVDAHNQTSQPGLFAAGDVTTMFAEHSLIAVGDGVRAAMRAYEYLLADVLRNA